MGWFGKLTFGTAGFFFGGPLGAIAGAALGHHLVGKDNNYDRLSYKEDIRQVEQAQAAYFISMFSILGKLAKADGAINREEIAVVDKFIKTLRIPEQEKMFAQRIFNEAKDSGYSIVDFAEQLYRMNSRQPTVLLSFMDLLFKLAAADGALHRSEEEALIEIRDVFRISEQQFDNIKACYFKETDRYYKILNCTPEDSDQQIKAAYKRLVKDFHPDTVISKGLPEEFVQFATGRFQEIQNAYENIRKERSF
ncbi:MAG: TerB family tellurite resistance protein [Deltaproteobacteria bacterium]|nr:TerB family tellurite resistance protein [Deltaproteobacteria bacterium]